MPLRFGAPIVVDAEAGVFLFAEAAPAPLAGFDPAIYDLLPCPVQWQAETLAQRRARLQRRRTQRREAGWLA